MDQAGRPVKFELGAQFLKKESSPLGHAEKDVFLCKQEAYNKWLFETVLP